MSSVPVSPQCTRLLAPVSIDAGALVERLRAEQALAMPALTGAALDALMDEASRLAWRPARAVIGKPPNEVRQAMDICTGLPAGGLFERLADEWQALWDTALAALPVSPFEGRLVFNDRLLQRYAPVDVGITPHRDRTGYRNLVCLFVIRGEGRFCVSADRAGRDAREIPATAGDVLLMRAPGFLGENQRPFHHVERIVTPRYVYGLRHEATPTRGQY